MTTSIRFLPPCLRDSVECAGGPVSRPARGYYSVPVDGRRLDERKHGSCRGLPRLLVAAVLVRLLEGVVDEVPELGVVLGQPDAVWLLGERLADHLELALVLGGEAREDD